jgi:hypothetical protein
MTTWNYRVVENEGSFAIHEAYYDDAGNVTNITVDAVVPMGESLAELRADLERFLKALAAPVLVYGDVAGTTPELE